MKTSISSKTINLSLSIIDDCWITDFKFLKSSTFKDLKSETQKKYELYVDNILNHNVNILMQKKKILDNIMVTEEDMEFINMYVKACIDKRRNRF